MKSVLRTALFLLLAGLTAHAADLKPAALFSDHMVLQRNKPVPVWGWADPGESITVEFAGQKKTTKADADGKWSVILDPMKENAEPGELLVQSQIANRKSKISDVLVGEVWLGSGQSNMAMGMGGVANAAEEKAAAKWPLIRMFKEESPGSATPGKEAKGTWKVCSPETVSGFSATLFCFGREIHRELKVPVGLINSSVGGTPIEAWSSAEAQKESARMQNTASKGGRPVADQPATRAAPRKQTGKAGGLFNGKIAPLIPYALRGAVWYQGESNANSGNGDRYEFMLTALVTDWRVKWGEDFPFAWVQLPNFNHAGDGWSLVREGMLKTLRLPKTGMAITIDVGEPGNIHPKNKQEVGRRLALWALGDVYSVKVPSTSGPLPAGHEVRGSDIVIALSHADGGLEAKGGELKGFVIAGPDKQWKTAKARIEGDKVIVSSDEVKKPVAVRYAWATNPDCNLYNKAGLPASPFRTDDW